MSFAIIQSQFFSNSFFCEFFSNSFVSAAKPITSLGLRELCLEICPKISTFFSKDKVKLSFFFIFSVSILLTL